MSVLSSFCFPLPRSGRLLVTRSLMACSMGLAGLVFVSSGCQSSTSVEAEHDDDHAHGHDLPESFHAAVAQLQSMREAIGTAIENDDPDAAHDPLHEIGHVLEALPKVAAKTELDPADLQVVQDATQQVFEGFSTLDAAFHKPAADRGAAYAEVKESIDEAIALIEGKLAISGEEPPAAHDHDGHDAHDHDGHDGHDGHDHDDHDHADGEHSDHDHGADVADDVEE